MKKILSLAFMAILAQAQAQKNIGGNTLKHSYASSFDTYYFCPNGQVVLDLDGAGGQVGQWKQKGDAIKITWDKALYRRGQGKFTPDPSGANVADWQGYAQYRYQVQEQLDPTEFSWSEVQGQGDADGMFVLEKLSKDLQQNYCSQPLGLDGKYPIASLQPLVKEDLAGLSKLELRIMRNEIFARRGLRFKTADMKAHFEKQSWYKGSADNVDDKLTPLELSNVELIKKAEAKAK